MNRKPDLITILSTIIFLLLSVITITGVCSFHTGYSYDTVNQYGETIKMWGAGIYAHDSYFKSTIFIGSDATILVVVIPLAIRTLWNLKTKKSIEYYIQYFSIMCILLYYSASIALGITYNQLHLLYIILFSACFYCVGYLFLKLYTLQIKQKDVCHYSITKGIKVYLVLSGISLFIAWLPDIITSLIRGNSLDLIEVYTTEITYVLDMGIISPLMFLTLYLVNRNSFIGYVLLRMVCKVCTIIGIMLPIQSLFQLMAGIRIPLPAFITKISIFVLLALFSAVFEHRLRRESIILIK